MTLLIYYAILWHVDASVGWYAWGLLAWIGHLIYWESIIHDRAEKWFRHLNSRLPS